VAPGDIEESGCLGRLRWSLSHGGNPCSAGPGGGQPRRHFLAAHYGECMHTGQAHGPRPPEGLRPAQLGIIFVGRVILGHVTATLVDLAQRGVLGLDETHDGLDAADDGADGDWLLIDRRSGSGSGGEALLDFERTMLDGLFYGNSLVRLSGLGETFLLPMNQMRKQLRRDAIRNHRLRRWGRGKRTPRGEQLLHQIHDFRRELRTLAAAGDGAAMEGLAPYAMLFGITRTASFSSADGDSARTGRRDYEDETGWAQAARLAQGFAEACGRTSPFRAWVGNVDFAHAWSAPREHHQGHGQAHSHGESYGSLMGGGGHAGGGGHGGH
jgi:hypothetical protein